MIVARRGRRRLSCGCTSTFPCGVFTLVQVLFKMDKFGACCEIRLSDIPENRDPSFAGFTPQMVMEMCILSGCDYLPSLPGVGLKKAHGFIQRFKSLQKVRHCFGVCAGDVHPGKSCIPFPGGLQGSHACILSHRACHALCPFQAVRFLRFNGTKLPPDFEASLARAVWTFKHQRVYDPATKQLVHLEPLPEELLGQDLDFLGPYPP